MLITKALDEATAMIAQPPLSVYLYASDDDNNIQPSPKL